MPLTQPPEDKFTEQAREEIGIGHWNAFDTSLVGIRYCFWILVLLFGIQGFLNGFGGLDAFTIFCSLSFFLIFGVGGYFLGKIGEDDYALKVKIRADELRKESLRPEI